MLASDPLDDRSERSGGGDLGPLPPLVGTVARSIATLEPPSGFTTMPRLMDHQARARLICLRQEGSGVVLLSHTNDQRFALQDKLRYGPKVPIRIDLALAIPYAQK